MVHTEKFICCPCGKLSERWRAGMGTDMVSGKVSRCTLITMVAILAVSRISSAGAMPLREESSDIITGSEFLSVLMGSGANDKHLVSDINKKEAPRLESYTKEAKDFDAEILASAPGDASSVRNSRSNKDELKENSLKIDLLSGKTDIDDDLQPAGSSFYNENVPNDRLKNGFLSATINEPTRFEDDTPKIIGVRVTSSVAVGRGSKTHSLENPVPPPPLINDENNKPKISEPRHKYLHDSPTTWRPPLYRFVNRDYYKGVPSNKQYISTLPEPLIGANVDYLQQQKEREVSRKKSENVHPYQRAIAYHTNTRPRSYSYSSVINTFGDSKLSTLNEWSSTKAESVATESTAGFVTIINHGGDNTVDENKDVKESDPIKEENSPRSVPPVPIVYSEPAKIYSEPAKIYSEPAKIYSKPEKIYSEPSKVYSEPAKNYGEPSKIYSEPAKVYGEPSKVYSEPAKIYSQPASLYHPVPIVPNQQLNNNQDRNSPYANGFESHKPPLKLNQQLNTTGEQAHGRNGRYGEQNYEVDESVSVMTNGRTHGVQSKPTDDSQKVGYVVEGRNYRKYRVEERTSDGFIVGEYGVVSHDDGSLRGVRYTADGEINPSLINDALMKFLSL